MASRLGTCRARARNKSTRCVLPIGMSVRQGQEGISAPCARAPGVLPGNVAPSCQTPVSAEVVEVLAPLVGVSWGAAGGAAPHGRGLFWQAC